MRYSFFLIIVLFDFCSPVKFDKTQDNIQIKILNKEIKLPIDSKTICSDTVYIQIKNNSEYEYLFDISDTTGFFFFDESPKEDEFFDPFDGFGIGFLDEDGKYLKSKGDFGFYPEGFEDIIVKNIVYELQPRESITLKVPLSFPSSLVYGSYVQEIFNINKTVNIEVLFRPRNGYLKNILLERGELELKDNQRIMDISKRIIVPVEFVCQYP